MRTLQLRDWLVTTLTADDLMGRCSSNCPPRHYHSCELRLRGPVDRSGLIDQGMRHLRMSRGSCQRWCGRTGVGIAEEKRVSDQPGPVTPAERMNSLDVLRGVALLGILTMNIVSLGLPSTARLNPHVAGGFTGLNFVAWLAGYFLCDEKMITIFSMLFGAGLVLMTDRAQETGRSSVAVYYRRMAILLAIGLIHAYLIWDGDILVSYALCGMLVYPLRRLPPRLLVIIAVLVMLPSVPLTTFVSRVFQSLREASVRVQQAESNGETASPEDRELAADWDGVRRAFHPTPSEVAKTIQANRDASYWTLVVRNAPEAFGIQTTVFASSFVWTVSGRMLIGMALMKWGVFSAAASMRFYGVLALFGYGLGWPVVAVAANRLIQSQFDVVQLFGGCLQINLLGSLFVALGHVAVVMMICKSGWWPWLTSRLAAVGRMALTNYLMQSLLCVTLFNGYGFGWYGTFDRLELYGIMTALWTWQLWYSPLWLKRFRFGPVEWLWRSLTYGTRQPLRCAALP